MLFTSCKTRKIDANAKLNKKTSVKEVLAIHNAKAFNYKTLQSRVKVNYNDGKKTVSPSISLRMEKDKQIWLSAKFLGFTVAKIYITPNKVSFYEKIGKRYYDGDFTALSTILGQEINFSQIQNLLLGQSILNVNSKSIESTWQAPNFITLKPKQQNSNLDLKLLFYIINAKVARYTIKQDNKTLSIAYPNYQEVESQYFPEQIIIKANKRVIDMAFKSVEINKNLTFPYSIPEGYTQFKISK